MPWTAWELASNRDSPLADELSSTFPTSALAVDLVPGTEGHGVLWCDGRRAVDLPPGARIEVSRSAEPVRLARLSSSPFTDRLVAKFDLSVHGWRGRAREDRS